MSLLRVLVCARKWIHDLQDLKMLFYYFFMFSNKSVTFDVLFRTMLFFTWLCGDKLEKKRLMVTQKELRVPVTHLCSSLRMWTLKVRGVTSAVSVFVGNASGGGTHVLNSDSQFCNVFTWERQEPDYIRLVLKLQINHLNDLIVSSSNLDYSF